MSLIEFSEILILKFKVAHCLFPVVLGGVAAYIYEKS